MSGIQISGLLANSSFDWKSVVDQLIAVQGAPITKLDEEKAANLEQVTALATLRTALSDLQESIQAIRAGDLFAGRTVSSDKSDTTWKSSSTTGAPIGNYTFAIQQLATAARLPGVVDIGEGLSGTGDVSTLTLANLATATPLAAGTFSVNGQAVTIALTDSLQDVFGKISTATGGHVVASYDPVSDGITLTSDNGELVLGASNDTSNFLRVMKLGNNGTNTTSSDAALGTLKLGAPLSSSGLRTAITAVDTTGEGTFSVNGVAIAYNVNTDTLGALLTRISQSGAGVTATYDAAGDRVVLANTKTGDMGIGVSESAGGLLGALGLTGGGAALVHGQNARFTVNGGSVISSASNSLDATVHGIAGLNLTVNTETTQTLAVESDTVGMTSAIQAFIDRFNSLQDLIEAETHVEVNGGAVKAALLSDNREVQGWASELRAMAFAAIGGLTGTVKRLDDLGIDFDGTTSHLKIKNGEKLVSALADHPDDVHAFFLTPDTGLVSKMYTYLTRTMSADSTQQSNLRKENTAIDAQIATLQSRLDAERQMLTTAFLRMLDAQSAAQSQTETLTNMFLNQSKD
ncbi:MAG: flagellar filament capping protein FliD [Opitutaceae bacterium]